MSRVLQPIREAAIDGRLHNVIYRQTQLEKLQKALITNIASIENAIRNDSGNSEAEVAVESILTLQSVKDYYRLLDADDALNKEYRVVRGDDAPEQVEPIGIAYIVPSGYTTFYSIIVALSAAIAAGNCVVVEIENTLQEIPSLIRKLLKAALDPSIVEFVTARATDADLGTNHIRVFQNDILRTELPPLPSTSPSPLISPSQSRVVAVVDRTANLAKAAQALVTARLSFGGKSPYAPDLILVNEYVRKDFLTAVMGELIRLPVNQQVIRTIVSESTAEEKRFEDGRKSGEIEVVTSTGNSSVFEVKNRNSDLLRSKINSPNLVIHTIKSLDDAISLATSENLLASYIFAAPTPAKYLSYSIPSHASFINHAPLELLVGPAALRSSPIDRSLRYPVALFSLPSGKYSNPSALSQVVHECLSDPEASVLAKALRDVLTKLKPKHERSAGGQIGFFEQSIFTGLGLFGTLTLASVGTIGYFGVRFAMKLRR
ncbi:putative PutA family dehydrogenase [Tricladium varicosporioides]|nr:putative PutA family dehydrogenase [Hymenoscyphus varicosporioides]